MKVFKTLTIIFLIVGMTVMFAGCDFFQSPFEQQIDRQNFAQENAQDMADQVMDNMESFGQLMPDINSIPPMEIPTETTTTNP